MNTTATPPGDAADPGARWQSWVGRREQQRTRADATLVALLEDTYDRPPLAAGASLPPLRHWLFARPRALTRDLDGDGHPPRGDLIPTWPLPRRMWAGSTVRWIAEVPLDSVLERSTRVASVSVKTGRTGTLGFVTLHHLWQADGTAAIEETQTIVYREAAPPAAAAPAPAAPAASAASAAPGAQPSGAETWQRTLVPDEAMLFRFSALTFNAHRIHYDRPYTTGTEGYPGLVVQGPMMAMLMLDTFRNRFPQARLRRFEFRAVKPAFDGHPLTLGGDLAGTGASGGRQARLWVRGADGGTHVNGEVEFD